MEKVNLMKDNYSIDQVNYITRFLSEYVTDHKIQLIEKVLDGRTRQICMVLEDIYKTHNASATLRTAECLGIQDVHIIQNTNEYNINPYVLRGSLKWLSLYTYGDGKGNYTPECFKDLREQGYKIAVTGFDEGAIAIQDFNITEKLAIVFGTEYTGISEYAMQNADYKIKIPMFGFTESFNVSVSVGIILEKLLGDLRQSQIDWQLTNEERTKLRCEWYQKIPPHAEELMKKCVNSAEFSSL